MENQTPKPLLLLTSKDSPMYSALDRWDPTQPSPLNRDELSRAIAELSDGMIPATDQQYAQALVGLIEFATAFGIPCPEPKAVQKIYHEALKHLPADLLTLAIARVKVSWVWGNRMPFPADILTKVSAEYAKRQTLLARAKVATLKAPEASGEKNVISAERWKALKQSLKQTVREVGIKHRPREEPDMTPEELEAKRAEVLAQCEQ